MANCRSALLLTVLLTIAACSGDSSKPVDAWVTARQSELPMTAGAFEWRELTVYENQVIATYVAADQDGSLSDEQVFEQVAAAVCGVTDMDAVWQSRYEHYVSVTSSSGETLQTIRTKSFDCCVLEASARMSREEAQNSCPYEEY
ncbi:MAG: hypothetical protein AAF229_02665 [Pseudomonadota bacterium]